MLKLTRDVEYALIALKHMHASKQTGVTSVREICDDHNLPFDATSRVLQKLVKKAFLKSVQGVNGGYTIVIPMKELPVYNFLEAVVGPVQLASCLGVSCSCKLVDTCNIISPLAVLNNRLVDFYKGIMLGDLFDQSSPLEPGIRERFKVQQLDVIGEEGRV